MYVLWPDSVFDEKLLNAVMLFGNSIDYATYCTDTVGHLLLPYYSLTAMKQK